MGDDLWLMTPPPATRAPLLRGIREGEEDLCLSFAGQGLA